LHKTYGVAVLISLGNRIDSHNGYLVRAAQFVLLFSPQGFPIEIL